MGLQIGKILGIGLQPAAINNGKSVGATRGVVPKFKTASYASIPYERAPQVVDTVPTRDANGNALLAGYVTPKHSWIA